jgi:hypothetical protein
VNQTTEEFKKVNYFSTKKIQNYSVIFGSRVGLKGVLKEYMGFG